MLISIWMIVCAAALFLSFDFILNLGRSFAVDRGKELSFRLADRIVRTVFSLLRQIAGFRFRYEKIPLSSLPPRFLVIANHQSLMDIPVVMDFFGTCRNVRFVAKRELGQFVPLVSSVLRIQGHALIYRKGDMHQSMSALARFGRYCARNQVCPVIFPEGTRSKSGEVGVFHSAGVRRILESGGNIPIVALAIDGGWKIRGISGLFGNLYKGNYQVRVVGIYDTPASKKEILASVAKAQQDIMGVVEKWHSLLKNKAPES